MRYAKGDYVVHPGQGVCQVEGVVESTIGVAGPNGEASGCQARQLYQMSPVKVPRVRITYPVAQEDRLRPVIGAKEARALIDGAAELDDDTFDSQQGWTLQEHFTEVLHTGDCREVQRVVKTMYDRMARAQATGRKPRACYATIFKDARQRLLGELSVALGLPDAEVERLICERHGVEPLAMGGAA